MNKYLSFLLACTFVFSWQSCSDDATLMDDIDVIEEYLVENNLEAQKDNSGLFFDIITAGSGASPKENDVVEVSYEGRLLDGTIFDSTPEGTTRNFRLSNLMEGWQIGLGKIKAGGEMTLYIPSPLAYGETARAGIPANSILIFDIKLVDVAETQSEFDQRKIENYLTENNLTAERHESGLHYIIEEAGSAEKPDANSEVLVLYQGYLLNGDVFDETNDDDARQFALAGLIPGWRIGIPFIGKGGKIKLIVPSGLGYSGNPRPGIPANSVLIFDIELKNFQ